MPKHAFRFTSSVQDWTFVKMFNILLQIYHGV